MDTNPKMQEAHALIAGGFADLLAYLSALPNPIVVGEGYPRKRLLDAFYDWAKNIDFNSTEANISLWRAACRHGFFRRLK